MIILMSLWFTSTSAGGVVASFLNGAGHVRIQVLSAPPAALASVAASVLLAPLLGAEGVVLAMVVAYTLGALTPAMVRALRLVKGRAAYGPRPTGPTTGQAGSAGCPELPA